MYFTDIDDDFLYSHPMLITKSNEYISAAQIPTGWLGRIDESDALTLFREDKGYKSDSDLSQSRFRSTGDFQNSFPTDIIYPDPQYNSGAKEDLQSVWLRSLQSKTEKLRSLLKTKSYKQEDISKTHSKPYKYYVSSPKTLALGDYFFERSKECDYRAVLSYNEPNQRIRAFEKQCEENAKSTQLLKDSDKLVMFYKNLTESIYFLTVERTDPASKDAGIMIGLIQGSGVQATATEIYHLLQLKEVTESSKNTSHKVQNETSSSSSYLEIFLNAFNLLSADFDDLYSSVTQKSSFDMSNVFQMSVTQKLNFQGELLVQSFSHNDLVFWFVHATGSEIYLTHFDLSEFNLVKQTNYTFPDNSIITSITCGKQFVVYSKLFDEYGLRELEFNPLTQQWKEKCHSEKRKGVYESVFLTHFEVDNNVNILNSRIKEYNNTEYIQLEILHMYDNTYETCIFHNQTVFSHQLNLPIRYKKKVDMFNKTYTIKSSHSGESFLVSLNRHAVHSIDWNEEAATYQFFDSFKHKSEIIDIIANDRNNTIAIVHMRDSDMFYLIHRELDTKAEIVKESYHKLLSTPFYELVTKSPIKEMRIETIDRGLIHETVLLWVFENGVFASFDMNFI